MTPLQVFRDTAARLSSRERLLIGAAVAIGFVVTAVYGVMLPGQIAARSAADRMAGTAARQLPLRR